MKVVISLKNMNIATIIPKIYRVVFMESIYTPINYSIY